MTDDGAATIEPGLGNTYLERDADGWCIVSVVDGIRKVIGRHANEQLARLAFEQFRIDRAAPPAERRSGHRP
jgi:hypothetical protein